MSKIYWQERNHDNWTGRVPRQARITGEWSKYHRASKRIPPVAYVVAAAAVLTIILACFV
jgi:hypothetical protein